MLDYGRNDGWRMVGMVARAGLYGLYRIIKKWLLREVVGMVFRRENGFQKREWLSEDGRNGC